MKAVVAPNFDTLYSSAFVDLAKEPMVLTVPDTGGRFYLMPMLDGWSDVFASPGSRTTGTQAGKFMIARAGIDQHDAGGLTLIKAPTPGIWIIGRTKTDGPPDYAAVHKTQEGYRLTPLSKLGNAAYQAPAGVVNSAIDMKAPPKETVEHIDTRTFFAAAGDLLRTTPATSPTSRSSRSCSAPASCPARASISARRRPRCKRHSPTPRHGP